MLASRPRGVWYPDLVGKINGYPTTQEKFDIASARCREQVIRLNAERRTHDGRVGITQGWAGPKRTAMWHACKAKARAEAKEIVMEMKKQGMIDGEDARGDEALEFAIEVVRAHDPANRMKSAHTLKDRLVAARLVLDFVKSKPVQKTSTKIEAAEDFLGAMLSATRGTAE